MMLKQFLIAPAPFAASSVAFARAPCAADPQAKDAAACDLAGWMSAYGRMTGELLNVMERPRADACMIKAAATRCDNADDMCRVRCLVTGGAKFIGGGCYHLRARHGLRGTPWEAPAEATSCTTR